MRFIETRLEGVWVTEPTPSFDERGSFARTFCVKEFAEHGLETNFVQHSLSQSRRKGTLRGMHFQKEPHAETKLVSCVGGAVWDVVVDIRPGSPTYMQSLGVELTPQNGRQLYIPAGFAHGFQTLTQNTAVHYLISQFYAPEAANGLRYDDPALALAWPEAPTAISQRDLAWPLISSGSA